MRLISRASAALLGAILVLSTFAIAPVAASGATTHFSITGLAATETAGVADSITVTALTAGSTTDTTFAGTVSFTSTDGAALLPGNGSTLTNGVGNFSVTFKFSGPQSVTVTDDADASAFGSASTTVNPAAATHFVVSGYTSPHVAGTSAPFDVSAIDAFNNVDTNYTGTVHFTSSDAAATLPADSTLTNGQGTFLNTVLRTAGTQSITGTDTVTASITGSQTGIVVTPTAATHFTVTGYPSPTVAGVSHNATVTALDQFNNVATGYTGTVHVTSSDGAAVLPANHAYTGGEAGVHNFAVTLNTVGAGRTITATDTVTASIAGTSAGITVVAANVAPVAVADSATIPTGSGFTAINVLANDTDGNGDTLHVSSATTPAHGSVLIPGGGANITYKPNAGFVGTDTFTYKANDGIADSNSATVTVHVGPDTVKPVVTAPVQKLNAQTLGASFVNVYIWWTGSDVGSGISYYQVYESINSHAWMKVKTTTGRSFIFAAHIGTNYRFAVRAVDKAGNFGSFAYGPTFKPVVFQETSAVYSVPWIAQTSTVYSGGTERATVTAGQTATFTTTARTFSWIGVRGPVRSTADVFIDGVLAAHLNLAGTANLYRYVIYSVTFPTLASHAFRVVYTGPTNRRIDVDAFVVLR